MPLTTRQLDSFANLGFIKIPGAIPAPLLSRLRELFDELMYKQGELPGRVAFEQKGKTYVTNLDNLYCRDNLACLELLGSPFILEIAEQICGPDFFLIQEFAVIKNAGDEAPVLWHQDMVNEQTGKCFTLGIYLDDAFENDGALRVVPGSHLSGKDICELKNEPFIEIPMEAGDMLIHDMMLAHSSEPMHHHPIRRVIYFEFLSRKQVLHEGIYTAELVNNRTHLIHAAMAYYRKLHPDKEQFRWKNELSALYGPVTNIRAVVDKIYSMPVNARPSAYCLEYKV